MSLQLIVYPQINPNGVYSFTSTANTNEYVGDSNLNGALAGTVSCTTGSPSTEAIASSSPIINAYKRFRTTGTGNPYAQAALAPTFGGGLLSFYGGSGSNSSSGIYQVVDNLVIGVSYELTYVVDSISGAANADVYIGNQYGSQVDVANSGFNSLGSSLFVDNAVGVGTYTHTFTATDTSELLIFEYIDATSGRTFVDKISIRETQTAANSVYEDFADGQVILDLYEETSIPFTLSVDEFKNAAEKPTSYSKSFRLPATKRNNQVFSNIFDVSRSTADDLLSFNPYKKTSIRVKEHGYTIFDGLLRLIDISENNGEISYNVNLYSGTTSLKELLQNKVLGDIDFSELEHDYNATSIEASFNGNLPIAQLAGGSFAGALNATTTSVLKYPLCDWSGNFILNDNSEGFTMELLEDGFRPFINLKYLVDNIFKDAGLTFSSTFLSTSDFTKLYIDFNTNTIHGGNFVVKQFTDNSVAANDNWTATFTGFTDIKFAEGDTNEAIKSLYFSNDTTFTATENNQTVINEVAVRVKNNASGSENVRFRVLSNVSGTIPGTQQTINIGGNDEAVYHVNFTSTLTQGETLKVQFVSETNSNDITQFDGNVNNGDFWTMQVMGGKVGDHELSMCKRGQMSQWDFFSGIIKMFNLVILETSTGTFSIEPYKDIFQPFTDTNDVEILDWTEKVDAQEFKLEPINTLKKNHIFTYKRDSNDYISKQYSEALGGYLFGTHTRVETTNDFVVGETKIEVPFAPTLDKRIFGNFYGPAIYKSSGDNKFEDFDNLPRILYDNGVHTRQVNGFGFDSPVQNHASAQFSNQKDYLYFSHYDRPTPLTGTETLNYNFGICQGIGMSLPGTDTLYNLYWQPYIDDLYDPDTRILKLKINLISTDVSNFRFYDLIRIKNRLYRVNKIDYKPGEMSNVELILK
jgi:hypothetical protein